MPHPRVLFLMPTRTYRASAFLRAASELNLEAVVASERQQALEAFTPGRTLTLDFNRPDSARQSIIEFHTDFPLDAIIPVDDDTAVLAAVASEALGLQTNAPESVKATREKHLMRKKLSAAAAPIPNFRLVSAAEDPKPLSKDLHYPCILKPVFLAASRGVIRANNPAEFVSAFDRIKKLLRQPELKERGGRLADWLLVEDYIPGTEVALEGLLTDGELRVLAIFDKPDPLEGPYFEETIYVTPSRLPEGVQHKIVERTLAGTRALGLTHGPIHAELRIHQDEPWILEIAARSIGGLCARTLRFGQDVSLEELILRHAIGEDVTALEREAVASGVMMIPIPRAGVLKAIRGVEQAKSIKNIQDVNITIPLEQTLVPLPEGDRYLGFIFARADTPQAVEASIREAFAELDFPIA